MRVGRGFERRANADGRSLANYVERLIEAADEAAQKGKSPEIS